MELMWDDVFWKWHGNVEAIYETHCMKIDQVVMDDD
jgi:hypothetical protein